MRTGRPPVPLFDRFLSKFDKGTPEECWEWKGCCLKPLPYGLIKRKDGAQLHANRVSWEYHCGPIPDGMFVLHNCDNPKCVNPNHLFLGTHQDNMDDMVHKNRLPAHYGEDNGAAKLKLKEVMEILTDHRSQQKIASAYGVSQTLISQIKLGKRWSYLTGRKGK
jgi:hypothetical protein